MAPLLEIRGLSKDFEGLKALREVDLDVYQGDILGLIGPNGSGKTTLVNVISGIFGPTSGSVVYKGQSIAALQPEQIARKGIARTYQTTSLFASLSVRENIITGCHLKTSGSVWGAVFRTGSYRREEARLRRRADEILGLIGLGDYGDQPAGAIPAAGQRNLEIGIALAAEPELLFLDEPAAGMNPEEQGQLVELVRSIQGMGTTVVVIEHNMKVIMGLCTRIVVLNFGSKFAEGTPKEILENEGVASIYLGKGKASAARA